MVMHEDRLRLIDVHHHFVPPFYLAENRQRIAQSRGGQLSPAWIEWTPERSLARMDEHNVATAILSLSTPGVWFGDADSATGMARRCNDYAADLAGRHPGRFRLFAVIALPDIDGALREIEYALDVLKADGIGLLTSYDGRWLGHADFMPVFEELNRRRVVVHVHPTTPAAVRMLLADVPPVIAEVPQDTARAIVNLLFTGTLSRLDGIRYIVAHAGGTLPMMVDRLHQYAPRDAVERVPRGFEHELRRLHYDIAGTTSAPAMAALTSLVPATQILFGSEEPHVPMTETVEGLSRFGFSAADRAQIARDNALRLLPHLGATAR
jgi:predicted TIM-barrel fold metal-dependent hydrolase